MTSGSPEGAGRLCPSLPVRPERHSKFLALVLRKGKGYGSR